MFRTCAKCGNGFKSWEKINGQFKSLRGRKYCLDCVPYGSRLIYKGKVVKRDYDEAGNRIENRTLLNKDFICLECGLPRSQKTRNNICSTCRSKSSRRKRKEIAVKSLGGKCFVCGYDKCLSAMDFHHTDTKNKIDNISRLLVSKIDIFEKELKKCILMCCRCHAELHEGMISISTHGEIGETRKT